MTVLIYLFKESKKKSIDWTFKAKKCSKTLTVVVFQNGT